MNFKNNLDTHHLEYITLESKFRDYITRLKRHKANRPLGKSSSQILVPKSVKFSNIDPATSNLAVESSELSQDLKLTKSRFLIDERKINSLQEKIISRKNKIKTEIRDLEDSHSKRDQEIHMADFRIRELERFIHSKLHPQEYSEHDTYTGMISNYLGS